MKVKTKLYAAFFVLIVLSSAMGMYSVYGLQKTNDQLTVVAEGHMPRVVLLSRVNTAQSDYRTLQFQHVLAQTPEEMTAIEKKLSEKSKMVDEGLAAIAALTSAERRATLDVFIKQWETFKENVKEVRALSRQNRTAEAMARLQGDLEQMNQKLSEGLDGAVDYNVNLAEQDSAESDRQYDETKYFLMAAILAIVVLSTVIAFYISRFIGNFISEFLAVSNHVSKGDLRQGIRFEGSDEFGEMAKSYNATLGNLKNLLRRIQGTAEQVAASSEELTASADQSAQVTTQVAQSISNVASASEKQLDAVNTTSSAIENISSSIKEVSANTEASAQQAAQAMDTAEEGGEAVQRAIAQMRSIEATVNESARVIETLGERSKEIGQIVDTISGIAGQTNLLALNAAIEAARAGEHGKGFAVVAEEVRKLAEQSQEAAKQIAELIGKIQSETDNAVTAMQVGTREVKIGTEVVQQTGEAFSKIKEISVMVARQIEGIAGTVHAAAENSQEIVASVKNIDAQTKQVSGETQTVSAASEEQSAAMEQIAASSQNLAKMSQDLQAEARKFSI